MTAISTKLNVTPGSGAVVAMYQISETDPGDGSPTTKLLQRVTFNNSAGEEVSIFQGQYRLTPVLLADGEIATLATDEYGQLITIRGDEDAGDDKINDVKKVEFRYTYGDGTVTPAELDGSSNKVVKGAPGYVDHVSISANATGAGIIYLRDSKTLGSGKIVKTIYIVANALGWNFDVPIHAPFGIGIEIDFSGVANSIRVQPFWR